MTAFKEKKTDTTGKYLFEHENETYYENVFGKILSDYFLIKRTYWTAVE